ELETRARKQELHLQELRAAAQPAVMVQPEAVVARVRQLGALFDRSPKEAREALRLLLDGGIELCPEDPGYRATWTVRAGALLFATETTKPPGGVPGGSEERLTLRVAGAGFEPTTFGL